jgi:hypothetical protein
MAAAERRAADGARCVPGPFPRRAAHAPRSGAEEEMQQSCNECYGPGRGLGPRRWRRRQSTGAPRIGAGTTGQLRRRRGARRGSQGGIVAAGADVRVTGGAGDGWIRRGGVRTTSPPTDCTTRRSARLRGREASSGSERGCRWGHRNPDLFCIRNPQLAVTTDQTAINLSNARPPTPFHMGHG